jgi:nicotinate-nucleotide adenylyltransferase
MQIDFYEGGGHTAAMNTPPLRIAVYGTAANPPHLGHMDCLAQLLTLGYELIYFLPSAGHAFGKSMKPLVQRLAMAELLVAERFPGERRIRVSGLEAELASSAPDRRVYSIDVLEHLRTVHPQAELHLAVGPDNAAPEVFRRFRAYQRLAEEFGVITLKERMPVRSTGIRAELGNARPNRAALERVLGVALTDYLLSNGLYKDSSPNE